MKRIRLSSIIVALLTLSVLGAGCGWTTPEAGEVGIIRNGGPFDNKNIRDVVPEGSGNKWMGFWSSTRYYPASSSQRTYKFDDTQDKDAEPREVFTSDGVRVRLTGTFYMKTAFDNSEEGQELLRRFDTQFSNRPEGQRPWEDWGGWLNSTALPIIDSNLRTIIAEFECSQLVSSCALVQNSGSRRVDLDTTNNRENVDAIAKRLSEGLQAQLTATLGEPYFTDIRFELGRPELPGVQEAIDRAQSAFAAVTEAEAKEKAAAAESRANIKRQEGYSTCPSCAQIDLVKAIPQNVTTFAPGGKFAVSAP